MAVDLDELAPEGEPTPPPAGEPWKTNKNGRAYVNAVGRHGIVYRVGDETIEQALARDANRPADQRPQRKSKVPKKSPPPAGEHRADLREIETILAEVFRAPAMPCAIAGDSWAADHFTNHGPVLARQLVVASQHNPWLRRKLEAAASGDQFAVALMSMSTVAVAAVGYLLPPLIHWFNIPVPEQARAMFGIPPRRQPAPSNGASPYAVPAGA